MKPSIRHKLEQISDRYHEITALLADPEVQDDNDRFRALSREYAQVEPVSRSFESFTAAERELRNAEEMLADPELSELAEDACAEARRTLQTLEPELQRLLLPHDPNDDRNVFLEVRAGTGTGARGCKTRGRADDFGSGAGRRQVSRRFGRGKRLRPAGLFPDGFVR